MLVLNLSQIKLASESKPITLSYHQAEQTLYPNGPEQSWSLDSIIDAVLKIFPQFEQFEIKFLLDLLVIRLFSHTSEQVIYIDF